MNLFTNLEEKKKIFLKKENLYFFTLAIIIFIFDRITKQEIISKFSENVYFINNFINFDLIWNRGIGFGLLISDSALFYNLVTTLIGLIIFILIYIFLISKITDKIVYSIIIGGAFGNFYDRVVYKAVPDFIDLHYNNFHWFIFNVADIFISFGIIAMLVIGLFKKN
jgi:signal peptidase II